MSEATCGACRHWVKAPDPPGPALLDRPAQGQCRAMPPQMIPMGGGAVMCDYPMTVAAMPACGCFGAKAGADFAATIRERD